ncbi:hypothetical protein G7Y89_g4680 [Cudoniella acicularis]|uniref:Na+/H+ antiporter n=1 Tax=Cudoniella acicularis TaxID=354080 RepID=A0A8H4RNY7_9HELO|nr:hypothetical protein G7Y89_g4680 [Cudoniella acicularis]
MAWDHLSINRPHLVYIILGGFTSLFMLCSSFVKERLYIGEATVATICGVIFGPHAANLINPLTWGNTDQVTLEFSRIVLVVQCFAVGVELPKYYMEKHWRSVVFLLIPVMTFGWLITSLFIWWMIPSLNWLESLCCAACVTATDPVLASSVVGKGKFAKRVPKHLRDLLSAESGCNDGMAFPFIYLALYIIDYRHKPNEVAFSWIVITVLYECVFGAIYGFTIGYISRQGIKYAEKHDLVDRESFLVFYFVLALFCAGSGSILGVDDLLVGFAAGVGFSNDGWFTQKTEESHVSNVIDLLLNLAYFVYLGTIIPWEQYNNAALGITPWRLVVIALFVIFFRRIPIMMALKPLIPDIKSWREALFAGHFGPIGVGAIFVAILARADLETGLTTPLAEYPDPNAPNYILVSLIWPITTFLVISSIIVHGSSIAVFTLGKHINTLALTMSYTTAGQEGPTWMNRLPRISSTSRSQAKSAVSDTDADELRLPDFPPGTLPPVGLSGNFLRRQKEEDNPSRSGSRASSLIPRRRKKKRDDGVEGEEAAGMVGGGAYRGFGPGGPISLSAVYPQKDRERRDQARRDQERRDPSEHLSEQTSDTLTLGNESPRNENNDDERNEAELGEIQNDPEMHEILHTHSEDKRRDQHRSDAERHPDRREVYDEGGQIIIEDEDGEVVATGERLQSRGMQKAEKTAKEDTQVYKSLRKKFGGFLLKDKEDEESPKPKPSKESHKKRGPALAYQFGNTIIVEDEDGEVVKKYDLPLAAKPKETGESSSVRNLMGNWASLGGKKPDAKEEPGSSNTATLTPNQSAVRQGLSRMGSALAGKNPEVDEEEDDRHIRFTIGGAGRRLTKEDFLREIQSLDPKARSEIVQQSDAPAAVKDLARRDASKDHSGSSRLLEARGGDSSSSLGAAKNAGAEMERRRGAAVEEDDQFSESDESSRRSRARVSKPAPAVLRQSASSLNDHNDFGDDDVQESAAERRRRQQALKGVDEIKPEQRGRSWERKVEAPETEMQETAAERRRREAALGVSGGGVEDDSDDDDTERVPPPVTATARNRGIRFAQSPVRGKK